MVDVVSLGRVPYLEHRLGQIESDLATARRARALGQLQKLHHESLVVRRELDDLRTPVAPVGVAGSVFTPEQVAAMSPAQLEAVIAAVMAAPTPSRQAQGPQ